MKCIKIATNFIKSYAGWNKKAYLPVKALPEKEALPIFKPSDPTLYKFLENYYMGHGFKWEEINVFGIRDERGMKDDVINDWICIADSKTEEVYKFKGSVDPGIFYTNHMISSNLKGVAHIALGNHPKVYMVGLHKGKYEAMVQQGNKIKIWRDVDKNFKFTKGKDIVSTGWYGVNIHRMSDWKILTKIGRYSAGCNIIQNVKDFSNFLKIVKNSNHYKKYRGGARFSYTLISINEIPKKFLEG